MRDGAKGPTRGPVLRATVQTKEDGGRGGPAERVAVIRSVEAKPRTWYALAHARQAGRAELARVQRARPGIEELFAAGNGAIGLDHDAVRSGRGWHHPRTLSLGALWFLETERLRLGGKPPAVTVPPGRAIVTELLREPRPSAERVAEVISRVRRRNEEAWIEDWHKVTGRFPPRRPRAIPRQRGQPTMK